MNIKLTIGAFIVAAVMTTPLAAQQQTPSVNVQGNTNVNATAEELNATASGVNNNAENNVGVIGGGSNVNIQGNTNINATVGSATATAKGVNNTAKNNVGVIGGKASN